MTGGADPRRLAALRARIDRLDRLMVRVLAARQRQAARIAALKPDPGAVRDAVRVAEVLARVAIAARAHGLSPAIALPVWRELLERSAEDQAARVRRRLDACAGGGRRASSPPGGEGAKEGASASPPTEMG